MTFAPLLIVTFSAYNLECLYVLLDRDGYIPLIIVLKVLAVSSFNRYCFSITLNTSKPRGVTFIVSPLPDVAL